MNYDDIIHLPHHQSATRKHLPLADRAAQFAPFAALTGYEDAVRERERLTTEKIELDEYTKNELNAKLNIMQEQIEQDFEVSITYFIPDGKKQGGEYVTVAGPVLKIREYEMDIIMADGTVIPIEDIFSIESELFERPE